jgi:hypothetical protein
MGAKVPPQARYLLDHRNPQATLILILAPIAITTTMTTTIITINVIDIDHVKEGGPVAERK